MVGGRAAAPLTLRAARRSGAIWRRCNSQAARSAPHRPQEPHWTYAYAGADWTALEHYPGCRGAAQSPINVDNDLGEWGHGPHAGAWGRMRAHGAVRNCACQSQACSAARVRSPHAACRMCMLACAAWRTHLVRGCPEQRMRARPSSPPTPTPAALPRVPKAERSMFSYGSVAGIAAAGGLINNGHTVQLSIPAGYTPSNASVVVVGAFSHTQCKCHVPFRCTLLLHAVRPTACMQPNQMHTQAPHQSPRGDLTIRIAAFT